MRQMKSKMQHLEKEVGAHDRRLSLAEKRTAVCGYQPRFNITVPTTLTFDRVYDEVNSGGLLSTTGYFTAKIAGVYFVTLKTTVSLDDREYLVGYLKLSSSFRKNYDDNKERAQNKEHRFIYSSNHAGGHIRDQASASRYVMMSAGETLHISLDPGDEGGNVSVFRSMLCVSLYSASG